MIDHTQPSAQTATDETVALGDTELFPGNWVSLFPELETPGIKTGHGLFCSASGLPVPGDLQERLNAWATRFPWRWGRGPITFDPSRKPYDDEGFTLARELSVLLPHWIIEFAGESGFYRTPSGQEVGIVTPDGAFIDLTEEQQDLRRRLIDEEYGG